MAKQQRYIKKCLYCGKDMYLTKSQYESERKKFCCPVCRDKGSAILRRETNLKRYGCAAPIQNKEIRERIKQTNIKKYGTENAGASEHAIKKIKQTKLERYGDENYNNITQIKKTCQERYGANSSAHTEESKNKYTQTCQKKYGTNCYAQTEEWHVKTIKTCQEKYGSNWYLQSTSAHNKIEKISKQEKVIYEILKEKFPLTESQYKTKEYPFWCDFYIPELDLYIEYQGTWTHGKEPFDSENIEHLEIIKEWDKKSKEINIKNGKTKYFYDHAIYVWTDLDVRKRQTAKENNLNFIEFFNLKEFKKWIESI